MLEIHSKDNIQQNVEFDAAEIQSKLSVTSVGSITLVGEIADSKCFLGVMKPGSGILHKACAEVCLLGDMPSMLISKDKDGNKFGYVLTKADGSSASQFTAQYAAEPVRVSGELSQQGDIQYIKIAQSGLQRL